MNEEVIKWAIKSRKKAIGDMADSEVYTNNEQKAMRIVSTWLGESTYSYMNFYKVCSKFFFLVVLIYKNKL